MPNNVTIAGDRPGNLKSSITINNGSRGEARDVTLVLEGPGEADYDSATPGPVDVETLANGRIRVTWLFPSIKGPGNETIKLTHSVEPSVANGTNLSFRATVRSADGRNDEASDSVSVRNR